MGRMAYVAGGDRAEVSHETATAGNFPRFCEIQCSQINLHHCIAAANSLNDWFADAGVHTPPHPSGGGGEVSLVPKIALVQEPYLNRGKVRGFEKNLKVFCGKKSGKIRACIAVDKCLDVWPLSQFSDEDQMAIGIESNGSTLILVSSYMPYDSHDEPPPNLLRNLVNFCVQKNYQLIIGADANSHNTAWGSTDINDRGDKLLDYILSTDLQICNVGDKPTFSNVNRQEVIHITLASRNIERKISGWRVSEKENFSDHNTIHFSILTECRGQLDSYRNVRKTDWTMYRSKSTENFTQTDFLETDSLEVHTDKLTKAIKEAYLESCRLTRTRKKTKPPWWTGELTRLKKEAARLKNRYSRNPTEENATAKKDALRKYTLEMQYAKRKKWKNFCSEMMDMSNTSRISKILKVGEKQIIGTIKNNLTGELSSTPEEALQFLLKAHFPDQEAGDPAELDEEVEEQNQVNQFDGNQVDDICNRILNKDALKAAFTSFKPHKAPGVDGIYPIMIQKGIDILQPQLLSLYRKSIKAGKVPNQWTESRVAFIPKPGKDDTMDPKSYRPISLTSFLLKGMERLILWDLEVTVEREKPLKPDLFSYREGKSTEDALHKVIHKIEKSLSNKQVAVAMFLDIEAAFNNATFGGMKQVLVEKGVVMPLTQWIVNSLSSRIVTAQQGFHKSSKTVTKGCPQGGILSPYLWNLIMDDLLKMFPNLHSTYVIVYADDVMLLGIGIDEKTIVDNLRRDVGILQNWANKHSLNFSPSKTKLMLFSRRTEKIRPVLKIGDQEIDWVEDHKYLGMHVDCKLNWNIHLKEVIQKATYTLVRCRMLLGRHWGLTPKVMKWLYTAVIRPIITYGSAVWIQKIDEKTLQKKLTKLQRKACLMITNGSCSTPTAGMEAILSMRPLHIHVAETAIASLQRMSRQGTWTAQEGETVSGHARTLMKMAKEIEELSLPTDRLRFKHRSSNNFEVIIQEREEISKDSGKPLPRDQDTVHVFTDGSKSEERSGAAYLIKSQEIREQDYFPLGPLTTVFQAETVAISAATRKLLELEVKNKKIRFMVDSQSAIKALGNYTTKNCLVKESKDSLNRLGTENDVAIHWIPGHEGHLGNEVADRLAKRGAERMYWGPEPGLPLTNTFFKNLIRDWGRKKHNAEWTSRTDCRQTKMFVPSIGPKAKKGFMNASRTRARIITQILTGHNNLRRHRYLMKLEDSPMCENCGLEEETSEHYITSCPAYFTQRVETLGSRLLDKGELANLRITDIQKFVNESERF